MSSASRSSRGEIPVLIVASETPGLEAGELIALYRAELASCKQQKRVLFVPKDILPRDDTGKIIRGEVESWLADQPA